MPTEIVSLPSSAVCTGPDARELVVAFRVSEQMTDIAVGVAETPDEIVVRVEASWNGIEDSSGGTTPYLTHASAVADLEQPVGTRRVRAVPDRRHTPGIC